MTEAEISYFVDPPATPPMEVDPWLVAAYFAVGLVTWFCCVRASMRDEIRAGHDPMLVGGTALALLFIVVPCWPALALVGGCIWLARRTIR